MFGKIRLISLIAALMLASLPVAADEMRDSVVSQLRQQGYVEIVVSRTWLGRTRILARRDGERREIIINPRTGEILRDFWSARDETGPVILANPSSPTSAATGQAAGSAGNSNGGDSGDSGDNGGHGGDDGDDGGDDGGEDGGDDGGGDDGGGDGDGEGDGGDGGDGGGESGGDGGDD